MLAARSAEKGCTLGYSDSKTSSTGLEWGAILFDLTGTWECMVMVVGDGNGEVSMMTSEIRISVSSPGSLVGGLMITVDR